MHTNFFCIRAKNNFDLGIEYGKLFGKYIQVSAEKNKKLPSWKYRLNQSLLFFKATQTLFPKYIEEVKGFAQSSKVKIEELWTMMIADDLNNITTDKCTALVTNNNSLFSFNEDWEPATKNKIWVIKKSINNFTVFELHYQTSLGGTSVSINSNGWVMGVNSMVHRDYQVGVPSLIIGRWLSDTKNPLNDFKKMPTINRALGFNHVFLHKNKGIVNIECTSQKQILTQPTSPFLHTNHYLNKQLLFLENTQNNTHTFERYKYAQRNLKKTMTTEQIIVLNSSKPVMSDRTIAKMVIDFNTNTAKVWLLREKEKSWIDYQLDFLNN